MTNINNFTRPPENCPELRLSVFRDKEFAQDLFDDNIEVLPYSGWGNRFRLTFYTDSKTVHAPEYVSEILDVRDLPESTILEIAKRFDANPCKSREEVADLRLEDFSERDYLWLVELPTSRYGVKSTLDRLQDDVYNVVYAKDHEPSFEWIDRLFWDTPVCCDLTVDGEEFQLGGDYEYDIDKIVEAYTGPQSEYVKSWLRDNLPERLNYE